MRRRLESGHRRLAPGEVGFRHRAGRLLALLGKTTLAAVDGGRHESQCTIMICLPARLAPAQSPG